MPCSPPRANPRTTAASRRCVVGDVGDGAHGRSFLAAGILSSLGKDRPGRRDSSPTAVDDALAPGSGLAIVALDGCMAFAVAGVLQVANGMVLRGGGSSVVSVRVATPSGGDATGFGRRTDPCRPIPGRAGQRGRGGAAADPRRTGRLAGRAPDLIMWMKSRAAEDVLLMSRKHPQRTPPPRRWRQRLNRHCAQTPGAGWATAHTVGRVRRLRRRCGHTALRLAVLPEPRISVVHQPHWFLNRKFRTAGGASSWGAPGSANANPARPRQR